MATTDPDKPRKRTGRPPKLTPQTAERILQAVRAGNYLNTAANLAGVTPSSIYRWLEAAEKPRARKEYREFRDALQKARAEAEVRVVGTVMRGIVGGVVVRETTRTLPNGTVETDRQVTPPQPREGLEFLARAFPERWTRRTPLDVHLSGADGGPVRVESSVGIAALAERVREALSSGEELAVVDAVEVDSGEVSPEG